MFNKIKNTVKKIDNEEFAGNIGYNIMMFCLVFMLYLIYKESTVKTNKYMFLFLFLLVSYCLIKYFLSCKQKFVPLLKGKFSLSTIIIIGYLVNLVSGLVILKLMDFFYGKIEVLNQQLIEKQLTDYPDMANQLFFDSVFSAPLMEEVIFRGLLLNAILFIGLNLGISKRFLFISFIIITSLLFGYVHESNNMLTSIYFALGGLNLGVIYLMSGNLLAPIIVHFLNNLIVFFDIDDMIKIISIFIILLLLVILIEYFSKDGKNIIKKGFFMPNKK